MNRRSADPYDPPNPDGPIDTEEFPTSLAGLSWLDDEDPAHDDSRSPFLLAEVDPE